MPQTDSAAALPLTSTIDFSAHRWTRVKENARRWWDGTLGRPLIRLTVDGRDPGRDRPELPFRYFTAQYPITTPADAIVDAWDYELSRKNYLSDAFPSVWPNFGPGVLAAFLGATLHTAPDTVWFHPEQEKEIVDLSFTEPVDPTERWLHFIQAICQSAMQRWSGLVQVGMADLGGTLDVLSTFRPGEKLLLDLYDEPGEVKRLVGELSHRWWESFDLINRSLQPQNPGYTAWATIFSEKPYYMFQCDFCYMIGPDMFREFVLPDLAACCKRIPHGFYHLDGPGELPHLDALLEIEELKGIQWIPGAGQPDIEHWPEVYRKIRSAGKLIQIYTGQSSTLGYKVLDVLAEQLGSADGILMIGEVPADEKDDALRFLERYGAL